MARLGKAVAARLVARPEFCIPISIERAFIFGGVRRKIFPSPKPQPKPRILCKITTTKTIAPVERIFAELLAMMVIRIRQIAVTETSGRISTSF